MLRQIFGLFKIDNYEIHYIPHSEFERDTAGGTR